MSSAKKPAHTLDFWRGDFGNAYLQRNLADDKTLQETTKVWARMLQPLAGFPPSSILEVGTNLGINLRALRRITDARLIALEPNARAREILSIDNVVEDTDIHDGMASSIPLKDGSVDLVFTSGVLIHISPDDLLASLTEMHRVSGKYILCAEYFSDTPDEISYRDQSGLLFRRDFGDYWMSNFPDLKLIDYGFFWKRVTKLDNLNWWVFEKTT